MNKNTKMITTEKEGLVLARLTAPMTMGILGIIIFNLVDTYFVGQLGTVELAALSFTFPVVLTISSVAHGLGVGMTAAVSRAAGEQNREKQTRLITWGMGLSFLVVVFFVLIGLLTIDPVFTLMGADAETLDVIREYMGIWYWGVIFVVIPMTGNSAIRGMGDTKTPSRVMLIAATMNTLLDPLLIFGIGPFPELGVAGAALATVFARAITFTVAWYILIYREKVISLRNSSIKIILEVWKEILHVGLPNTLSKIIVPLASGIITGMIAVNGREAVAGFGIATRLDMFAMIIIRAMVSIIPIFVGQNWGAGLKDRVVRGLKLADLFSMAYGFAVYLILLIVAKPIIKLINDDPDVIAVAVLYMRIVPLSYGLQGLMLSAVTTLNVLRKPVLSALLTLIQMFGFYIPLAWYASRIFGLSGIFTALALSYLIAGPLCSRMNKKVMFNQMKVQG
ncbi:MATE family efflux transporter [Oceanispirochaeta sp.]|uniref:MATE family efflux transporter n=1 Tax=Oceanispirochaeta sp. TaxID=2035350 RepID=UPI0026258498|nr:MATE family efflux transporter [Oceanispirochaeta sp.]MDA3955619.1 MATE family efflux transporter [Oceanispirochaeta sp.]